MDTDNDVSAELSTFFQEGHMTDMEQVESSSYIHHYIIRLREEGGRGGEGGREGGEGRGGEGEREQR